MTTSASTRLPALGYSGIAPVGTVALPPLDPKDSNLLALAAAPLEPATLPDPDRIPSRPGRYFAGYHGYLNVRAIKAALTGEQLDHWNHTAWTLSAFVPPADRAEYDKAEKAHYLPLGMTWAQYEEAIRETTIQEGLTLLALIAAGDAVGLEQTHTALYRKPAFRRWFHLRTGFNTIEEWAREGLGRDLKQEEQTYHEQAERTRADERTRRILGARIPLRRPDGKREEKTVTEWIELWAAGPQPVLVPALRGKQTEWHLAVPGYASTSFLILTAPVEVEHALSRVEAITGIRPDIAAQEKEKRDNVIRYVRADSIEAGEASVMRKWGKGARIHYGAAETTQELARSWSQFTAQPRTGYRIVDRIVIGAPGWKERVRGNTIKTEQGLHYTPLLVEVKE